VTALLLLAYTVVPPLLVESFDTSAVVRVKLVPLLLEFPGFLQQIRKPNDMMPPLSAQQISDAEVADVFAFLKSLEKAKASAGSAAPASASGNAENGKKLYVSAGCYQCHSREGQGGAGTGPRLAPNPIALAAFIRQCRQPANQMPPYTSKVLTDGDLTDIYAFMLSIPKPPDVSTLSLLKP